jgi:hypothetical protein
MNHIKKHGLNYGFVALCAIAQGCSAGDARDEQPGANVQELPPGQCNQATAKDVLIAALVKDSWVTGYPLTRLYEDAAGLITGPGLPDLLVGDLEIINTVPDARESVARALEKSSGLPDYEMQGMGPDVEACFTIPAWTPTGTTTVDTVSNEVFPGSVNYDSWRTVHKEFGKECPLVKRVGNRDIVDPPGDGSTNSPPSLTVSATGVTTNAFGICPTGTTVGSYCKLSYASGVNYTGRTCQVYYGSLRCLLY